MTASFVQAIIQALLGVFVDAFKSWQADQNLKALGYAQAQRDAAVTQIKAVNAVVAAQQRMAAVPAGDRAAAADRLSNGSF